MKRPYKRKLTLWFKGDISPVHPGPYQVSGNGSRHRRGGPILYSYWDQYGWGLAGRTAEQAVLFKMRKASVTNQNRAWRGRTAP